MEIIEASKKKVGGIFKNVPNLSHEWQKWLGKNIWWMIAAGVVFAIAEAISVISIAVQMSGRIYDGLDKVGEYMTHYGYNAGHGIQWPPHIVFGLIAMSVVMLLCIMAIAPLKEQKADGWNLLFVASIVANTAVALEIFMMFNVYMFIQCVIGFVVMVLIGWYFLFQIKDQFKKK